MFNFVIPGLAALSLIFATTAFAADCGKATNADRARIEQAAKFLDLELSNPAPEVTGEKCQLIEEAVKQGDQVVALIVAERKGQPWRVELQATREGGIPIPSARNPAIADKLLVSAVITSDGDGYRQFELPSGQKELSKLSSWRPINN